MTKSQDQQIEIVARFGAGAQRFWDYWNGLPKTFGIPSIADFLDNSLPDLQPSLSIVDFISPTKMRVRLLGTKLVEAIGELTWSSADSLYRDGVRQRALALGWAAVNQPCGYIANRTIVTRSGREVLSRGLSLPIATSIKSFVTLNTVENLDDWQRSKDQVYTVTGVEHKDWLDIGFGTPSHAENEEPKNGGP
jgi:hypothetical protein